MTLNTNDKSTDQRRIFISYNRGDENNEDVKLIIQRLYEFEKENNSKWKILMDTENLTSGDEYVKKIQQFITTSHVVVYIISEGSIIKPFVNQEIGYALAKNIPLFPISINKVTSDKLGMINGMQVTNFSEKGSFSEDVLWEKTKPENLKFEWQFSENSYLPTILEKFNKFANNNKLLNREIRFAGTFENLNSILEENSSLRDFLQKQLQSNVKFKIIIFHPNKISIQDSGKYQVLISFLLTLMDEYNKCIEIRFTEKGKILKENHFTFGNLILLDFDNHFTLFAPFISEQINCFEDEFARLSGNNCEILLKSISQNLKNRPTLLNNEISVEQRYKSIPRENRLDREIREAEKLSLFVNTIQSFKIRLEEDLRKKSLESLFPNLKVFKIYIYSFDVVAKHPPGKDKTVIMEEWVNNLQFILEKFSNYKKEDKFSFDIIILNSIPTFTGIHASNGENKIFKITSMIYGVEPINIPQFIGWSDEYFYSDTMEQFEGLIDNFSKSNRPQISLPIVRTEKKWKRFPYEGKLLEERVRDFVDLLKTMSNEFPCCKHDLYEVSARCNSSIKSAYDIGEQYKKLTGHGIFSIANISKKKWQLSITDDKNELHAIRENHVIASFAIILNSKKDQIILIEKWKKNLDWSFDVPGGKMLHSDESSLEITLKRELLEELGIDINLENLQQIFIKYDSNSKKEGRPCIPVYYIYYPTAQDFEYFKTFETDTRGNKRKWYSIDKLLSERTEKCHIPKGALFKIKELG